MLKTHPHAESRSSFKYPPGGLLQLRGVVQEEELRNPTMLDKNGESCLIVLKNGTTTGLTMGRASGIGSFVRYQNSDSDVAPTTAMELAIHPSSREDGPFSGGGDSRSAIVDGRGRIVGILTGGTGTMPTTDITYATPYYWLDQRIKDAYPGFHLYPIVTA